MATLSKARKADVMAADDGEIEMRLADPAYVAALPSAALEVLGALLERLRPEVVARVASTQGLLAKMSQEQVRNMF